MLGRCRGDRGNIGAMPSYAFRRLPQLLARECSAFVARAATSVRQVESSHPCECAEQLLALHCPVTSPEPEP